MSSTATNIYDNLFCNTTPLGDDEIQQESSYLSENDRGAKGSTELLKNHIRATQGTKTKYIALSALSSNAITTDIEKKQSQGNYRNKGSGGKAGGGYQRKTFTKTTGSEKINNVTDKSPTNNNSKKKGKKAGKLGEATPKDPTPVIGVTQLGEYMQKMVTLSSDPNLAATAQIISDLCQGKV